MSQTLSFQKPAFRTSSFFAVFSSVVARCLSQYMWFVFVKRCCSAISSKLPICSDDIAKNIDVW
jgi:hypothetical protein